MEDASVLAMWIVFSCLVLGKGCGLNYPYEDATEEWEMVASQLYFPAQPADG
jgi:hypothetical protein